MSDNFIYVIMWMGSNDPQRLMRNACAMRTIWPGITPSGAFAIFCHVT